MYIEFKDESNATIIHICCNSLNSLNSEQMLERTVKVLSKSKNIVINLLAVKVMDSSGLGYLINCYRMVERNGGEMKVVVSHPTVLNLLEMVSFKTVCQVMKSIEEALGLQTSIADEI
jgi:anti-anti-sigma factor